MMSSLDLYIRPLNIIYSVEGKFYTETFLLKKIFSLLVNISSTFFKVEDSFNFNSFCEIIENREINPEFWKDIVSNMSHNKHTTEFTDKIINLFSEALEKVVTVNPYVIEYFKGLKSRSTSINILYRSTYELPILRFIFIKIGVYEYISSFVNISTLEKLDTLSIFISYDLEELMNFNRKNIITALSLLILDDSPSLEMLKEKNKLYFVEKIFPDFVFEMVLQTNCLIDSVLNTQEKNKKVVLEKFLEGKLRVLYIFPKKYKSKFYRKRLVSISNDKIYFIPYFGYKDLSINGSFEIILQRCTKFTDNTLMMMKNFSEQNPEILVIDHFTFLDILFDRFEMSNLISNFVDNCEFIDRIKYPKYFMLHADLITPHVIEENMKKFGFDFPIMIKNVNGNDHGMFLILNLEGLKLFLNDNLASLNKNSKILLNLVQQYFIQEYINHGGIMIKTYFLNETNKSIIRPSLPNIDEEIIAEMPHFKKGYFEFYNEFLYQKEDKSFWEKVKINENLEKEIDYDLLDKVSHKFNEFSSISLYGLDFMYDEVTKLYYLLEINYFPSYREFGLELYKFITEHILKCYKKFKK